MSDPLGAAEDEPLTGGHPAASSGSASRPSSIRGPVLPRIVQLARTCTAAARQAVNELRSVRFEESDVLDLDEDSEDEDGEGDGTWRSYPRYRKKTAARLSSANLFVILMTTGWLLGLFYLFPFPTTIHIFLASCVCLLSWTATQLFELFSHLSMVLLHPRHRAQPTEVYRPLLPQNHLRTSPSVRAVFPAQWSKVAEQAYV